jgi:hypothetical protein
MELRRLKDSVEYTTGLFLTLKVLVMSIIRSVKYVHLFKSRINKISMPFFAKL